MELQTHPEAVKQVRWMTNGQLQVLVKWKGLEDYDSTWESYEDINIQFPSFHLEDKVALVGAGDDGPAITQVYFRRNKKDNKGRNVLHNLAADDDCNWGRDIIHLLLQQNIAIDGPEGQDDSRRSPLHWAVSTGKKELCEMLITRPRAPRANINAREKKDKTPLHVAVAHGREDIVGLLIHYGADITAKSDGGWTVLHNACQQGSVKILRILLDAGAEINAQLLNGRTPLHEAVHSGHCEIVKELLLHKECNRAVKDTFGITPFVRAAQKKHKDIIHLLAPFNHVETLSEDALGACNGFNATIIDFGNFPGGKSVQRKTVYGIAARSLGVDQS